MATVTNDLIEQDRETWEQMVNWWVDMFDPKKEVDEKRRTLRERIEACRRGLLDAFGVLIETAKKKAKRSREVSEHLWDQVTSTFYGEIDHEERRPEVDPIAGLERVVELLEGLALVNPVEWMDPTKRRPEPAVLTELPDDVQERDDKLRLIFPESKQVTAPELGDVLVPLAVSRLRGLYSALRRVRYLPGKVKGKPVDLLPGVDLDGFDNTLQALAKAAKYQVPTAKAERYITLAQVLVAHRDELRPDLVHGVKVNPPLLWRMYQQQTSAWRWKFCKRESIEKVMVALKKVAGIEGKGAGAGCDAGTAIGKENGKDQPNRSGPTNAPDTKEPDPKPAVELRGRGDPPIVLGKEKSVLTLVQYDTMEALLAAGDGGLTKDRLDAKAGHTDCRKCLYKLREDPDWAKVILMPGRSGKGHGYRILSKR